MAQAHTWEREYQKPQLIQLGGEPRQDLKDFMRFLRKSEGVSAEGLRVLDLGSGTGKNTIYLAEQGSQVVGLEISPRAVAIAQERAKAQGVSVDYRVADFGAPFQFPDQSFDLVIDVMSSNSLNDAERAVYLQESFRVLKNGGHMFVRALCLEGDKNARNLLATAPGSEHHTYRIKEMDLVERVFTKPDFIGLYGQYFTIQQLDRKSNYATFQGQSYKRNYWLAYLKKDRA